MKASQPKATRSKGSEVEARLPLDHFVERMDQFVSDGDGEGVHVLEMHIERPFRDSRLANEIVNCNRSPGALGEQG